MTESHAVKDAVVALVVLRSASGREITAGSQITAESLHLYAPDPHEAHTAANLLAGEGFKVGPVVGISMSVTGSRALFEQFFETSVHDAEEGGWVAVDARGRMSRELPLASIPSVLAQTVQTVCFEPPAELAEEELGL